jgi:predicted ArsR family transcriptional regulator
MARGILPVTAVETRPNHYSGRPMGDDAHTGNRLPLLKALGDNTRYAIYLEIARAPRPLATAEIAESLGLHPNTVRPHLERMREVGLLEVGIDPRRSVGRPQHRYTLAADAPSLGLEPPTFPVLARMLLRLASAAGAVPDDAADVGREHGSHLVGADAHGADGVVEALTALLGALGFDPEVVQDEATARIAFTHCPFAELAAADPDLVCSLHRGMVEGYVDTQGGAHVESFHSLVDRTPCQVQLAVAAGGSEPIAWRP